MTAMAQDNYVVLDIETRNSFQSVGAYDASKLQVSCVGVYTSHDDQFVCFAESELDKLWPLLENSSRVVGFNLYGFDYLVLQQYYSGQINKLPTLDMLAEFKKAMSFRIKLDTLAQETLGVGKSGDGLQAIRLWEQGKLKELYAYCLDDVKITRDLFLQGRDKGVVYYPNNGTRKTWMVDWEYKQPPSSDILTLPF